MIRGEIFQIAYLMAIVQFVKRHSLASLSVLKIRILLKGDSKQ